MEFESAVRENVTLAPMTTLLIGGPARFFADLQSSEQVLAGFRWSARHRVPVFVLGGGSNVVFSDHGFPGLVMRNAISGIQIQNETAGFSLLIAGAGEKWDDVVHLAVANKLAGIECLSGIPGSVGATPIQNVGAYGQEVSETIVHITAFDTLTNATVVIDAKECGFGYRTSRFKTTDTGRFLITSVTYRLHSNRKPSLKYAELNRLLDETGHEATLPEVREAVLAIRRSKGMVIDPADPDSRSVGSFFVNPVVDLDTLGEIERRLKLDSESTRSMPSFPAGGGRVKLSAAWLIERAGFAKGYCTGRVGLSSKHSLAIVARQGGTAREVMDLAATIQDKVWSDFGVRLVPEPTFVGPK
jgi:UDP-N-acetylmuramate dehydrogenase